MTIIVLAGCSATFVEKRRRVRSQIAEVGLIDAGGGQVKYGLKGPEWIVRARRRKAFKKMAEYCEGKDFIRIEREYSQEDSVTPFNATDLDEEKVLESEHYRVDEYRHILFRCESKH